MIISHSIICTNLGPEKENKTFDKKDAILSCDKIALQIPHTVQNSKQINIAKYVSKFLIYGAIMSDKCDKGQK